MSRVRGWGGPGSSREVAALPWWACGLPVCVPVGGRVGVASLVARRSSSAKPPRVAWARRGARSLPLAVGRFGCRRRAALIGKEVGALVRPTSGGEELSPGVTVGRQTLCRKVITGNLALRTVKSRTSAIRRHPSAEICQCSASIPGRSPRTGPIGTAELVGGGFSAQNLYHLVISLRSARPWLPGSYPGAPGRRLTSPSQPIRPCGSRGRRTVVPSAQRSRQTRRRDS